MKTYQEQVGTQRERARLNAKKLSTAQRAQSQKEDGISIQKCLTDPCFERATPCWTSEDPPINMTSVGLFTSGVFTRECMHCANLRSLGGVLPGDEPEASNGESQSLTASVFLTQSNLSVCLCTGEKSGGVVLRHYNMLTYFIITIARQVRSQVHDKTVFIWPSL